MRVHLRRRAWDSPSNSPPISKPKSQKSQVDARHLTASHHSASKDRFRSISIKAIVALVLQTSNPVLPVLVPAPLTPCPHSPLPSGARADSTMVGACDVYQALEQEFRSMCLSIIASAEACVLENWHWHGPYAYLLLRPLPITQFVSGYMGNCKCIQGGEQGSATGMLYGVHAYRDGSRASRRYIGLGSTCLVYAGPRAAVDRLRVGRRPRERVAPQGKCISPLWNTLPCKMPLYQPQHTVSLPVLSENGKYAPPLWTLDRRGSGW